jgi:hypothetical protein
MGSSRSSKIFSNHVRSPATAERTLSVTSCLIAATASSRFAGSARSPRWDWIASRSPVTYAWKPAFHAWSGPSSDSRSATARIRPGEASSTCMPIAPTDAGMSATSPARISSLITTSAFSTAGAAKRTMRSGGITSNAGQI